MVVNEINPIVIIGGTFDPVHCGHIRIAHEIQKLIPQAEISFMPAGIPSHRKETIATPKQRFEMLNLALESETGFVIDQRELIKSTPSYSIESVEEIHHQQPNNPLIWVMGRDAYEHLNNWHRATELKNYCHLLIVERPGYDASKNTVKTNQQLGFSIVTETDELLRHCFGKMIHLSLEMLDISSTQVRELLIAKKSTQLLIADNVRAYIDTHRLYQ